MQEWWNAMSLASQILFIVGLATTVFLVTQLIFAFIGMGSDGDVSDLPGADVPDFGTESLNWTQMKLLSIRTITAFLAVGSWVGYIFVPLVGATTAIIIGVVCGIIVAILLALAFHALEKTQSNGNVISSMLLNKSGEVYFAVPPSREGQGKVNVFLDEKIVEVMALTDNKEVITTGTSVKVVGVINEGTILVTPKIK